MGIAPTQPAARTVEAGLAPAPPALDAALLAELWRECAPAGGWLEQNQFARILQQAAAGQNFGLPLGETASRRQQTEFFRGLRLADLVLAQACAAGNERAWEYFMAQYRQPLIRAAIAIAGSETLGRELADQLYAELYGLAERGGERRCPLLGYRGRGSLLGWLRTTLAQRHVDHYRRNRREEPLEEMDAAASDPEPQPEQAQLTALERAVEAALREQDAEERLLLAAHYLDGRTLLEVGRLLHVHEATASRRLRRAAQAVRKLVLRHLQREGLSRQAALEALETDPRDLNLNLKKLLQNAPAGAFQEKMAP